MAAEMSLAVSEYIDEMCQDGLSTYVNGANREKFWKQLDEKEKIFVKKEVYEKMKEKKLSDSSHYLNALHKYIADIVSKNDENPQKKVVIFVLKNKAATTNKKKRENVEEQKKLKKEELDRIDAEREKELLNYINYLHGSLVEVYGVTYVDKWYNFVKNPTVRDRNVYGILQSEVTPVRIISSIQKPHVASKYYKSVLPNLGNNIDLVFTRNKPRNINQLTMALQGKVFMIEIFPDEPQHKCLKVNSLAYNITPVDVHDIVDKISARKKAGKLNFSSMKNCKKVPQVKRAGKPKKQHHVSDKLCA